MFHSGSHSPLLFMLLSLVVLFNLENLQRNLKLRGSYMGFGVCKGFCFDTFVHELYAEAYFSGKIEIPSS